MPLYSNYKVMKYSYSVVAILLNILFCAILLWFFSYNAFLRPYLGSTVKEFISGLLLLVTLYANYYILYPKLYLSHTSLYWLSVVIACLVIGCVELASGYSFIMKCNAVRISECGSFYYFSKHFIFIFCRNLAFNFFPYMLRDRKHLRQSLDTEVRVVYQYARMIDVCDGKNNCMHIPIDDIFYCKKNGNEAKVYTVDGAEYTRYSTIKYLTQLLDNKEFIRISPSIIVSFQFIASCVGEAVVMKTMPWMKSPLAFKLDSNRYPLAPHKIQDYLKATIGGMESGQLDCEEEQSIKSQSAQPKEKLDTVFDYIREHPGCRSTELMSHTSYPKTTMERYLSYLKKQGLIEYTGSKKKGGYYLVNAASEMMDIKPAQQEEKTVGKLADESGSSQ